jgi:protein-tyrosine-phosphatase/predicted ATP-grasp superfamily ATP-dependent carboligase
VLVLDGDQASALAIVRSLGRRSLQVHVAASISSPLCGYSRHAVACATYPDPMLDEPAFVDWLTAEMQSHRFGLAIPVTERTLVPVLRHRHRLPMERLAVAPPDAVEKVLDKARTFALAEDLGIPIPRSVPAVSVDEALRLAPSLGYPVVVKPSRSVGTAGDRHVQLTVSYAHDAEQLRRQVEHGLRHGSVILQEYFRGEGVGVELIADRGVVRYMFQHRRLHEVPLTGGGSSLRISEAVTPALGQAAEAIMAALQWHGVAMVEFKHAPASGDFRLMEVNGRFWGSLPLAMAAGADFPAMLHALLTTGKIGDTGAARVGIVCRNLGRDLDWVEHVLRRAAPPELVAIPSRTAVLRDTLLVLSPRHHFDVQCLADPKPGIHDLMRIARQHWQRVQGAILRRRRMAVRHRAARADGASHRMRNARKVLFLCYGNINRSALAQAYAQARHAGTVEYLSAGFHGEAGRPADTTMVEIASSEGVDLSRCQSRTVSADMVREADLILAMELDHLDRLEQQFPEARGKSYLLGARAAQAAAQAEIPDPYGRPASLYRKVHSQVTQAVDAWMYPCTDDARPARRGSK